MQAQERLFNLHDRRRLAKDQEAAIQAELSRTEDEFKDDLIMIQLKITPKDQPHKKGNTLTFLNLPLAYSSDTNVVTLLDVIAKVKKENAKQYVPYNKSILTRILAPMLQRGKVTMICHLTKAALRGQSIGTLL